MRFESHLDGRVVVGRDVEGLHHVTFSGRNSVGRGTVFGGSVKVGFATTLGANCFLHGPASLGSYCQLGPAVAVYGRDHGTSTLTTYINNALFDGELKSNCRDEEVCVGNDVWIGHGAILTKGVRVGHGAVIGAGAVVTSSVPDYMIFAGNPARLLRPRFPSRVIELLLKLEWWSLSAEELNRLRPLFQLDFNAESDRGIELLTGALARNPPGGPPRERDGGSPRSVGRDDEAAHPG